MGATCAKADNCAFSSYTARPASSKASRRWKRLTNTILQKPQVSIRLNAPTKTYQPGQKVTGKVILPTRRPIPTKELKVMFYGGVSITIKDYVNIQHVKMEQECVFNYTKNLLELDRDCVTIPAGNNEYPFSFQIPRNNVPSTYFHELGKVAYAVECQFMPNCVTDPIIEKCVVNMEGVLDLNQLPELSQPVRLSHAEKVLEEADTGARGNVTVHVGLPKTGFVPSEIIRMTVEIENLSGRDVPSFTAKLVQTSTFLVGDRSKCKKTIVRKATLNTKGVLSQGGTDTWHVDLGIPPVPLTDLGGCKSINVQYKINTEVVITNGDKSGVKTFKMVSIPITIGSVQIRDTPDL